MAEDFRQNSMRLLARIDQAIAETESLVRGIPPDDTKHQEAVEALADLREARRRLDKLINNEG